VKYEEFNGRFAAKTLRLTYHDVEAVKYNIDKHITTVGITDIVGYTG